MSIVLFGEKARAALNAETNSSHLVTSAFLNWALVSLLANHSVGLRNLLEIFTRNRHVSQSHSGNRTIRGSTDVCIEQLETRKGKFGRVPKY